MVNLAIRTVRLKSADVRSAQSLAYRIPRLSNFEFMQICRCRAVRFHKDGATRPRKNDDRQPESVQLHVTTRVDQPGHPPLRTNSPCNGSDFPGHSAGAHGFSRARRSGQEKFPPGISAEETSQLWKLPNGSAMSGASTGLRELRRASTVASRRNLTARVFRASSGISPAEVLLTG